MGWTYLTRNSGMTDREFFQREWSSDTVILDCATVNNTFYAATENRRIPGKVTAAVILVRRCRGVYNFGYKDMDENMGPCESKCPERILNLLTETESAFAIEWRARCRNYANSRAKLRQLKPGDVVTLASPMTFGGGMPSSRLTKVVMPRRKNVYMTEHGQYVRFTNLPDYSFS